MAEKLISAKILCIEMQPFNCCLVRNGELSIKSLVIGILHKKTTNFTSNQVAIVTPIVTPPHHAICPPMRYFKPIEVVSFV